MVDKNNLNRIKGILRASNGAEIPNYIVKPGDTLNRIIIEYNKTNNTNLSIPDVASWNNIADPNKIQVGQTLNMAKPPELNGAPVNTTLPEKSAGMNYEDPKNWYKWKGIADFASNIYNTIGDTISTSQLATDSKLTKGLNNTSALISDVVKSLGPKGQLYSEVFNKLTTAGDIIQEMGGGTDQQTKLDKWMDSSFFSWNIGMLNGFKGENSDSFSIDNSIAERVGGAYGGALASFNEAAEKANKKYGLFSFKAREKTNKLIAEAKRQQNLMGNIADEAELQRLNVESGSEQTILNNQIMFDGGYNQKYTYAAKHGGILEQDLSIKLEWEPQIELNWELPEFQDGGSIELREELEWIPELQEGGKTRNINELIEYAKKQNPRFIQRLSEPPQGIKFIDDEGNEAEGSHYLTSIDNYVIPRIQEIDGKLQFLNEDEAYKRALDTGNYLELTPEEANIFAKEYKQGWPEFFQTLKQGGSLGDKDIPEIEETTQKNVIPEGALHKNKHHMEHAEGLTKKGIPVVDEDGDQQAEIEHSEIIFTLEVTKKLEEYYNIFYSEESSNKEKEQAAEQAGKLLVYQILENTDDRTGLIESCKKGGQLTHKNTTKSEITKNQMKEAMKEALLELLIK